MAIGKLSEEEVVIVEARKTGKTRWSFEVLICPVRITIGLELELIMLLEKDTMKHGLFKISE